MLEECGRTFEDRFKWVVGNGKKVFFWEDNGVGFGDLRVDSQRFYLCLSFSDVGIGLITFGVEFNLEKGLFKWVKNQTSKLLEEVHSLSLVLE